MAYNAKTDWKYDDPVTEDDFNRIEKGIEDAHVLIDKKGDDLDAHEEKRNNPHRVTSEQINRRNQIFEHLKPKDFNNGVTSGDIFAVENNQIGDFLRSIGITPQNIGGTEGELSATITVIGYKSRAMQQTIIFSDAVNKKTLATYTRAGNNSVWGEWVEVPYIDKITKSQVGLENVDNVKQATKKDFDEHTTDKDVHFEIGEKSNLVAAFTSISEAVSWQGKQINEMSKSINKVNIILESQEPVFGVVWDKSSGPELERTDVSKNMVADIGIGSQIVSNDFDDAPIFGDMVKASYGSSTGYVNHFTRIPKFYIRKQDGPRYKSLQISKNQYPGFYLPKIFWDFKYNRELDFFDYGRYLGRVINGQLVSRMETFPEPLKTIVEHRNYAKVNGEGGGYQINDIHAIDALRTLMIIEFATLDIQSVMLGFTRGRYHSDDVIKSDANAAHIIVDKSVADNYVVGQSISVGSSLGGNQRFYGRTITGFQPMGDSNTVLIKFSGDAVQTYAGDIVYNTAWLTGFSNNIAASSGCIVANDGKHPCMYRGIESPFGDMYEWIDGININNHQAWIADNAENYASNVFANPYKKLGYVNSKTDGYVKQTGFDPNIPYAEFPVEVGGSTSTYYADNYFQATGQRVARFGGHWHSGASAGLSLWLLTTSSSNRSVHTGARLLRKPL